VAGEGVERGSAGLPRSTRGDVTWPNRRSDLRLGKHPLYHPGGTACVLALAVEKRRCLRHCRRLGRAPARHTSESSFWGWKRSFTLYNTVRTGYRSNKEKGLKDSEYYEALERFPKVYDLKPGLRAKLTC
jgi:hypothetical protein